MYLRLPEIASVTLAPNQFLWLLLVPWAPTGTRLLCPHQQGKRREPLGAQPEPGSNREQGLNLRTAGVSALLASPLPFCTRLP
jgi:hypothetical protein